MDCKPLGLQGPDHDGIRLTTAERHAHIINTHGNRIFANKALVKNFDFGPFDKSDFEKAPFELFGERIVI
jgi:hypothetical protein